MGKISDELMKKYVYGRLGKKRYDVLIHSKAGIDVSITSINGEIILVSHLDPIVGAVDKIGWLAVNVACNDIATSGIKPFWIMSLILLPEKWEEKMLDKITSDIDKAASDIGVSVIGGHTGYAPGLNKPLVSITALGVGKEQEIVLNSMAKPGDKVIVTKGVALEGTAILASDFKDILLKKGVSSELIENALNYFNEISVVKEAVSLAEAGLVNAMHDVTRGGVAEALLEMASASEVIIESYEEKMPVRKETSAFAKKLNFDPLWMISSGTLLISVSKENEKKAIAFLEKMGIKAFVIGEVVKKGKPTVLIHRNNGKLEKRESLESEKDELARLWDLYSRKGKIYSAK